MSAFPRYLLAPAPSLGRPARRTTLAASLTGPERLALGLDRAAATEGARRRVDFWRETYFPARQRAMHRLLGLTEGDEEVLAALVSAGAREVLLPGEPAWLRWWHDAMEVDARLGARDELASLSVALVPWIRAATPALERALAALPAEGPGADRGAVLHSFVNDLSSQLLYRAMPVLGMALNSMRVLAGLSGGSPQERFGAFCARLGNPSFRWHVLQESPALLRLLGALVDGTVAAWCELIRRLALDWGALQEHFQLSGQERLEDVQMGLGDRHNGGRTVATLRFSGGRRVVYKPRPLGAERAFQRLLHWLNARLDGPPLRAITVVDRGTYGWVEFVEHQPCASAEEVGSYYEKLGRLLALTHALDATDLHNENLIAAGADPVIVDLESLFHGFPLFANPRQPRERAVCHVVTRIGLLPAPLVGPAGALDLSGMAEGAGTAPFEVPQWEGEGRDDLRLVDKPFQLPRRSNLPVLAGAPASILGHEGAFLRGFERAYHCLVRHRDSLLEPGGPLDDFRAVRVRVVIRDTYQYARMLVSSVHPNVVGDAMERDAALGALLSNAPRIPALDWLIRAEIDDMRDGDVPYFSRLPRERTVTDSRGRASPPICDQSPFDQVVSRIRELDESALAVQSSAIRSSLATLRMHGAPEGPTGRGPAAREATDAELRQAIHAIAARLADLALIEGRQAFWTTIEPLDAEHYTSLLCYGGLYSGAGGIGLFLAHAARLTGERRFDALARAALRNGADDFRRAERGDTSGAYSGLGARLYLELQLSALWNEPERLRRALPRRLRILEALVRDDEQFDLMAGAAGALMVAIEIDRATGGLPEARALASACAERLASRAVREDGAACWPNGKERKALLGLSHGTAGIAVALAAHAARTGEGRWMELAREALAYERRRYDAAARNWPDLRGERPEPRWSWCHGAPGVGIGRIMLRRWMRDAEIDVEIDIAVATTLERGFGGSHSLCHGALGNLDLLLLAGGGERRSLARRHARGVLEDFEREGRWRCGVADWQETPGLMAGLAGIGYGLLRVLDPEGVPSVLALESPRAPARES